MGSFGVFFVIFVLLVLALAGLGLALAACGSAGGGDASPTAPNPALGTNKPATSSMPSGDPYSEPGY